MTNQKEKYCKPCIEVINMEVQSPLLAVSATFDPDTRIKGEQLEDYKNADILDPWAD